MPTYEYSCEDCAAAMERWQRFQDSPLTECPACGGKLRRVFNSVGILFKGSGWYCTDSRTNKADGEGSSSKAEPAAAGAKA